jgi:hypothetical protein
MSYDSEHPQDEDGEYKSSAEPLSAEDIRLSAELASYLENECHLDIRRLSLQVRNGNVHIQGSVETKADKILLEEALQNKKEYKSVDSFITVIENWDE